MCANAGHAWTCTCAAACIKHPGSVTTVNRGRRAAPLFFCSCCVFFSTALEPLSTPAARCVRAHIVRRARTLRTGTDRAAAAREGDGRTRAAANMLTRHPRHPVRLQHLQYLRHPNAHAVYNGRAHDAAIREGSLFPIAAAWCVTDSHHSRPPEPLHRCSGACARPPPPALAARIRVWRLRH
jgi:hypothetical protein